ncbi:MAG: hypothetical protein H0Z18_03940 [Thermococcus sp.]|uniref:LamG domain-containing protein n=1 Tax=Thermococcus sp. TaxID=35749 RepID=UPI001DC0E3EC|nr:LamG domain-containing protein [Thermococcus sp.]MBO8174389.1 hypothetical protein [Thermococcus sp.]
MLEKKKMVLFAGILFIVMFSGCLYYEDPTPQDGDFINKNYVEVKVRNEEFAPTDTFIFNWNGAKYIFYNADLVLCMNFNNNTDIGENSTKAVDISHYKNNATLYGPTYIRGVFGKALSFDGIDDYAIIPDSSSLDLIDAMTIEFWILVREFPKSSVAGSNYATVISKGDIELNNGIPWKLVISDNGYLGFVTVSPNGESAGGYSIIPLSPNEWTHIVITFNLSEGQIRYYKNGELVYSETKTSPLYVDDVNIILGQEYYNGTLSPFTQYFNGAVDELRIYKRSLTPDEVKMHYKSSIWREQPYLMYFYVNITGLSEGMYTFYAWSNDTQGYTNWTSPRTVTIDLTPPTVKILYPEPKTYKDPISGIKISATDNTGIDSVVAEVNGVNFTLVFKDGYYVNETVSFNEGSHIIKVYVYDMAGNVAYEELEFSIGEVEEFNLVMWGYVYYAYYQKLLPKFNESYDKALKLGIDNETLTQVIALKEKSEKEWELAWENGHPLISLDIKTFIHLRKAYLYLKEAETILEEFLASTGS